MCAVKHRLVSLVKLLIQKGADVKYCTPSGYNALHTLCVSSYGTENKKKKVEEEKKKASETKKELTEEEKKEAEKLELEIATILVKSGIGINAITKNSYSPI